MRVDGTNPRPAGSDLDRRRFLALSGTLSAAAVLAACTSGDDDGRTASKSSAGGGAGGLAGKITVWDPSYKTQPGYTRSAEALDALFMKKFGVKVDRQPQPFADYDKLLQAAFTGRTGPDVTLMLPSLQGVLRWQKGLRNLTPDVKDLRADLKFWNSCTADLTDDGEAFGVPIGTTGIVFYYNKLLFARAGLDADKPPTTYDELVDFATTLKSKGITPFGSGNKEGYENQWWFAALWAGLYPVEESIALAKGEIAMTDAKVVEVFKKYQALQDADFFGRDRFSLPLVPEGVDTFSKGKAAMFLGLSDGVAHFSVFNKALGVENVGYFQAPGVTAAQAPHLPVTPSYVWSVTTFAKNVDAAIAFVRFCGSAEAQGLQYKTSEFFPNNSKVALPGAAPQLAGMFEDFKSRPTYVTAHQLLHGTVLNESSTLINQVLQGREQLDAALQQLEATNQKARRR
jgi:multiple sugar transport system substrate-binding protein